MIAADTCLLLRPLRVLGLNFVSHDMGLAVAVGGRIVVVLELERLFGTRCGHGLSPWNSIGTHLLGP